MTETAVENLPVVHEPSRLDDLARLGTWLALSESGSESEKAKGAAAALRLYYAAELGLPPLAVAELSVIKGRLFVSAQLLRALAERAGYHIERMKSNSELCTARLVNRNGTVMGESTFTMSDAKRAGLIRNESAWQTHPERMLWARASKNVIVDFAPSVALGLALDDEIVEYTGNVDSDAGVVVETTYYAPGETAADFAVPADVKLENERRIRDELGEYADEED